MLLKFLVFVADAPKAPQVRVVFLKPPPVAAIYKVLQNGAKFREVSTPIASTRVNLRGLADFVKLLVSDFDTLDTLCSSR